MNKILESKHGIFKHSKEFNKYEGNLDNLSVKIYNSFIEKFSFDKSTEILDYILENTDTIYSKVAENMLDLYNNEWRGDDVFFNGIIAHEAEEVGFDADDVIITYKESSLLSKSEFIERLSIFDIAFDYDDDPFEQPVNIYIRTKGDLFGDHCLIVHMDSSKNIKYVGF